MTRWISIIAACAPLLAPAQEPTIKDPVEFAEQDTGYQCQLESQDATRADVSCASEVFLGDGFWCDHEGYCEPVYDVSKQNWCLLRFDKIVGGDYKFLEKTCESRQVD